ncbi:hypothetical protein ACOMHN_060290 [Nucella lapillus]
MFVPGVHARVHITGMGGTAQKRNSKARQRMARRKLGVKEILRLPCLMPTVCVIFLGLLVLAGGAGMCVFGYVPNTVTPLTDYDDNNHDNNNNNNNNHYRNNNNNNNHNNNHNIIITNNNSNINDTTTTASLKTKEEDEEYHAVKKSLSYVGPILMGCGFFAIIVSCVLYCEIVDRYAIIMPSKPQSPLKRGHLLEMILGEFKKSYFRGIEVPLRKQEPLSQCKGGERQMETLLKALSISTPVLLMSPDLAPTWRFSHYPYSYRGHHNHRHLALKPRHPKLKQLGGSGSSGHEPWLKTSSLPNICDPEFRRQSHPHQHPSHPHHLHPHHHHPPPHPHHHLPRPIILDQQQEMGRARRMRRFGRPSRSMENRISWSLPQTLSRSSSGVDNPAYLHEQDRKKSVSMCVHDPSLRRPPGSTRFIKASQLQPRVRLQQQQQQHIHKQQQQLKQHQQHHHHQQQQQQQQQQKRLTKQHSSRESDESHGRRQGDPDESRPRQRPKLVRTKGAHKSFDSSGESSFSNLILPSEPPPFPLPAHFIHTQQQDTLQAVSPRTAKLIRAKCKSEDVRDKKKPDIMLLKDLFRSVDVQDLPVPPPTLGAQLSTCSMPCTISSGLTYLDPLAGKQCENIAVTLLPQDKAGPAVTKPQRSGESAFTRVKPQHQESRGTKSESVSADRSDKYFYVPLTPESCLRPEQKYELPLLAGVAGTNRQWEAERRKKISRTSRHEEKSHSLDAKDTKTSRLDARKAEIHRAHSFNFPLAQESNKPTKTKLLTSNRNSQDRERDSSNFLRVFLPLPHKSRPKSWDGDKSQSLDTPTIEDGGKMSRLTVPRMERASSFDPVASPCRSRNTKQVTSYSSEYVRPTSPYPCRLIFESEIRTGRCHSEEIRHPTPPIPSCLKLPVPLQPQRLHTSPDRSSGDLASAAQHHHHARPQQPPQPPQQQLLTVPTVKIPHRQSPSPRLLSPSHAEKTLKPPDHRGARELSSPRREPPSHELKPPDQHTLKPPTPKIMRHSKTENELCDQKHHPKPERQLSEQQTKSMKHSHTDHNLNGSNLTLRPSAAAAGGSSAETRKRRATISHQASVHLSLDSCPDSAVSMTSSTPSSTDNTTSSVAPLLPSSSASTSQSGSTLPGLNPGEGGGADDSSNAMRRIRYTQSRSVAIEESSPDDEDTENTPLIQNPPPGNAGKS